MAISRLSLKISAPIILVSALAIGLTVFLNVGKLERTIGEVEESRLRFTLGDLRDNLETGLDLGLAVQELGNAQAAIEFEASQDPAIVSISVVDAAGSVVFHTGERPDAATLAWRKASAKADRDWIARDTDVIVAGTRLSNNLGIGAGALVLRYSRVRHANFISGVARELSHAAVGAIALATLILMAGIHLLVGRMNRTYDAMEAALADEAHDEELSPEAAALSAQVRATTRAAFHDLDTARGQEAGALR